MTTSNVGSSTNLLDVTIDFANGSVLQFECAQTEGDMALAMDKFLTTDEVADKMRVSRNTVIQMIDRGELRATRFGKQWRIREVDLIEYVTRNYNQPIEDQKKK
jgi:excisionase family DNA binding protein